MNSRREDALDTASDLLADIELERLSPVSIVRKASRLARLMDDVEAVAWIGYEVSGYPSNGNGKGLSIPEWKAASRSGRCYGQTKDGITKEYANAATLSELQAKSESAKIRLTSSASDHVSERHSQQQVMSDSQGVIDKVIGSIYRYVAKVHEELRFGSAVETAFDNIRSEVDERIASIIPEALPILSTAMENAQTDNPEQWKNAAKACRDLVKAAADSLRPSGPDKKGKKMGDSNYVNRLVDWIEEKSNSKTKTAIVVSDLKFYGKRLDAVADGGNKGTHANVSKVDAARFIVSAYMLLGDILSLDGNPDD